MLAANSILLNEGSNRTGYLRAMYDHIVRDGEYEMHAEDLLDSQIIAAAYRRSQAPISAGYAKGVQMAPTCIKYPHTHNF